MAATFTREVREELARRESGGRGGGGGGVGAVVRSIGILRRGGGKWGERYAFRMETTVRSTAERVYSFMKSFGVEEGLVVHREPRFQKRLVYQVEIEGSPAALQTFNEMGVLSDSFRLEQGIPGRLVKRGCCRKAFLRGCILGGGSINAPRKETHLALVTPHPPFAQDLVQLLQSSDIRAGLYVRRGIQVVYVKGREQVAEVLAIAGAAPVSYTHLRAHETK